MSRWFSADVSQSFKQTRSKIEVFWNVIAVVALGLYAVFGANGCPAVMSLVKLNAHCFLLNVSYFANSLILFGLHQTSCLFLYRSAPTAVLSNLLKCQLSLLSYFILKLYLTYIVLHLHLLNLEILLLFLSFLKTFEHSCHLYLQHLMNFLSLVTYIHVDDLTDSNYALKFISLLDLANLTQYVSFSTLSFS